MIMSNLNFVSNVLGCFFYSKFDEFLIRFSIQFSENVFLKIVTN